MRENNKKEGAKQGIFHTITFLPHELASKD